MPTTSSPAASTTSNTWWTTRASISSATTSRCRLFVEVDGIYHLACPASPVHYQHDPVQTTRTSVYGAINMLGLAKRTRARIFQASTSEVHGDPDCHPQPEGYRGHVNLIGPRSCQDEGKRWSSSSACRTAWSSGNCRSTTWRARPNSSTWSG